MNTGVYKTWAVIVSYEKNDGDTKVVIRSRKSRKDRQYNGHKEKDEIKKTDLQNIKHKKLKTQQHEPH